MVFQNMLFLILINSLASLEFLFRHAYTNRLTSAATVMTVTNMMIKNRVKITDLSFDLGIRKSARV